MAYLNAQIESGVQAVMVFDTWGGALSHAAFHEFSLPICVRCWKACAGARTVTSFRAPCLPKAGPVAESLADTGADCVGLDWTTEIARARARIGHKVALQGNLDPGVLFATPEVVRSEAARVLAGYGSGSGHVFNLGHGVSQFTPPDNVATLVEAVHELSRSYHQP